MKKVLVLALVLIMLFTFAACTPTESNNLDNKPNDNPNDKPNDNPSGSLGTGTISDVAKTVESKLGIKYQDMYSETYGITAEQYPDDKMDVIMLYSKVERTNEQRKADIIGFINYFKGISDDGKVYSTSEMELEWTEDFYTGLYLSVMIWAYKKGGVAYGVSCTQTTAWCAEAAQNLYTYTFRIAEAA